MIGRSRGDNVTAGLSSQDPVSNSSSLFSPRSPFLMSHRCLLTSNQPLSMRTRLGRLCGAHYRFQRGDGLMEVVIAALVAISLTLSLGLDVAQADPGSACSADPDMDCRPDPSGYLDQLHTAGITGNSDQTLLTVGHRVCADLEHGAPSALEAAGLRQTNPSMTLVQGNVAVDAAIMNLCPQLMRVDNREPVLLPLQ